MSDDLAVLCGVLVLFAAIFGGVFWMAQVQCDVQASAMRVPYSWGPMQGCMITVNDKTIPIKSYRIID